MYHLGNLCRSLQRVEATLYNGTGPRQGQSICRTLRLSRESTTKMNFSLAIGGSSRQNVTWRQLALTPLGDETTTLLTSAVGGGVCRSSLLHPLMSLLLVETPVRTPLAVVSGDPMGGRLPRGRRCLFQWAEEFLLRLRHQV